MENISTLRKTAVATAKALEDVRSHTFNAMNRAYATLFFIDVHGFFEANPAITSVTVDIHAEGGTDDEGHTYTNFSLDSVKVEVTPDVSQSAIYGFDEVSYDDLGQIRLDPMDPRDVPLSNDDLVSAIQDTLQDCDRNQEWLEIELPWRVADPEGRDFTVMVNRAQVDRAGDILLRRSVDGGGMPINPNEQQIQNAQDEVIGWVEYQ